MGVDRCCNEAHLATQSLHIGIAAGPGKEQVLTKPGLVVGDRDIEAFGQMRKPRLRKMAPKGRPELGGGVRKRLRRDIHCKTDKMHALYSPSCSPSRRE